MRLWWTYSAKRDFVFVESINGMMIRNSSCKLIQSENIPSQFFDLQQDPMELKNQLDNPSYRTIIREFQQQIDSLIEQNTMTMENSIQIEPLDSWARIRGLTYEEPEHRRKTEQWFLEQYSKRLLSKQKAQKKE